MISQDMLVTHMLCHALKTVNQKRIVYTLEYFVLGYAGTIS